MFSCFFAVFVICLRAHSHRALLPVGLAPRAWGHSGEQDSLWPFIRV